CSVDESHEEVLGMSVAQGVDQMNANVTDRRASMQNRDSNLDVVCGPNPDRVGRQPPAGALRLGARSNGVAFVERFPSAPRALGLSAGGDKRSLSSVPMIVVRDADQVRSPRRGNGDGFRL